MTSRRDFLAGAAAAGALAAVNPAMARSRRKILIPELEVGGAPADMGRAHGKRFARAVKRNFAFYSKLLVSATGAKLPALLRQAGRFAPVMSKHTPDLLEEIRGISSGAGLKLEEVLMINARTDLLVLGRGQSALKEPPGCTAMALEGRTKLGALALGQTWDWNASVRGNQVLLRLKPKKGPRLLTFTEAGMVGKIGMNQHGLGVTLNFLAHPSDDPEGNPGIPIHCLLRYVMGCQSLEEAVQKISWLPRCASACFTVASSAAAVPRAECLELTPTAVGRLPMQGGVLAHTNHYLDPALSPATKGRASASSLNRYKTAARLALELAGKVPDPAQRMRGILASREGAPNCISKDGGGSVTLAGVVMDLTRDQVHLAAGPPHKRRWKTRPGVSA